MIVLWPWEPEGVIFTKEEIYRREYSVESARRAWLPGKDTYKLGSLDSEAEQDSRRLVVWFQSTEMPRKRSNRQRAESRHRDFRRALNTAVLPVAESVDKKKLPIMLNDKSKFSHRSQAFFEERWDSWGMNDRSSQRSETLMVIRISSDC